MCPTYTVSFSEIHKGEESFYTAEKYSLQVTAPTEKITLQNLINTTWSCKNNPGTLGVDNDAYAYFAVENKESILLKGSLYNCW